MLKVDSAYKLSTGDEKNLVVFSIKGYHYIMLHEEEIFELPKELVEVLTNLKILLPTASFLSLSEEDFVNKTHRSSRETPPYTDIYRYDVDTEILATGGNLFYVKSSLKERDGFHRFFFGDLILAIDIKDRKITDYYTYEEEGSLEVKELPLVFAEIKGEGVYPMRRSDRQ